MIDFHIFSDNLIYRCALSSTTRLGSNMARCPPLSPQLMLLLMLLVVAMVTASADSDALDRPSTSFCEDACRRGTGGNACQCSITKFAGKRARTSPPVFPPFYDDGVGASRRRSGGVHRHVTSSRDVASTCQSTRRASSGRLALGRPTSDAFPHQRHRLQPPSTNSLRLN